MLLKLFGEPSLTAGAVYPLRSLEALTVAYISLTPQCDRSELAGLLWPHAPPVKARHSLSQMLYSLKRRYNVQLSADSRALSMCSVENDITLLKRDLDEGQYHQALRRIDGPFLAGISVPAGKATDWRDELDSQVTGLVSAAVSGALSTSSRAELSTICAACEDVLKHYSYLCHERKLLVHALFRSGNADRAHRHYNELRASGGTDEQLPSFEKLIGDSRYAPVPTEYREHAAAQLSFVGREPELQSLLNTWRQTQNGVGATRVICGEPGIGKTRFSTHFLRRVAISGGRTWVVHCTPGAQRLPFSAIKGLLDDAGIDPATVSPEITFLLNPGTTSFRPLGMGDYLTHVLVEALTSIVLEQSVKKPLAILIDDAQWADDFTATLLAYWSYRLRTARVLILTTVRIQDVEPIPGWLHELTGVQRIVLGRLSDVEVSDLLANFESENGVALTSEGRNALVRNCGGVPFLLLEQLNEPRTRIGSEEAVELAISADDLLSRRFRQLSPECAWIVGLVAVKGDAVGSAELADWSGLTDIDVAAALDVLQTRGILRCNDGTLSFPHDLMRDTAYRHLGAGTKSILHHRIAGRLATQEGQEGIAAQHYAAAGEKERCSSLALAAASSSLDKRLYGDAEFYYRLVLTSGSQDMSAVAARQLLRLLLQIGRIDDGENLIPLIPASEDDSSVAMLTAVATLEQELVRGTTSTSLVERTRSVSRMTEAIRAAGLVTVGTSLLDIAMDAGAKELGREVVTALEQTRDHTQDKEFFVQTQALAVTWDAITEGHARANARLQRINPLFSTGDLSDATLGLVGSAAALVALYMGDLKKALQIYEDAVAHAEAAGDIRRLYVLRANWGVVCMELGRFDDARRAFEMAATAPKLPFRMRAYQNLSLLHYEQSDYALAEQAANAVLVHNSIYEAPVLEASARAIHGLCALSKGDLARASEQRALIEGTNVDPVSALNDNSYILGFVARMLSADGRAAEASALLVNAASVKRNVDVLCALRLECEAARIIATVDTDVAFAMAKRILNDCRRYEAVLITDHANQVLSICRLSN